MKMRIGIIFVSAVLLFVTGCTKTNDTAGVAAKTEIYYCPMHPEVTAAKPAVCPICHMDLVKKAEAGAADSAALMITAGQEITSGISTIILEEKELTRTVSAYGAIEIPEDARKIIAAKFNGRIETLRVARSGEQVRAGQPLMTVYSPDVQKAAAEYLAAASFAKSETSPNTKRLVEAARKKLLLYGLSEAQIAAVESSGEAPYTFEYLAPFSGVVLEKKVLEGAYFSEGTALYETADLSTVWFVAEVFESDAQSLKLSAPVTLTFPSLPGAVTGGAIQFISPVVEKQNRTVSVRVALRNAGGRLRPLMYGTAQFSLNLGRGVAVPASAVQFNGRTNVVWIKTADKTYAAREVTLGQKFGDEYQVLSGLGEGDIILSTGGYLLDSESQLKTGSSGAGHHTPESGDKQSGDGAAPQTESHGGHTGNTEKPRFLEANDPLLKTLGVYNAVCPVLGDEVAGKGPHVLYKGKIYGFCCKGCDRIFFNDPETYLKNLSKNGKKFTGKAAE